MTCWSKAVSRRRILFSLLLIIFGLAIIQPIRSTSAQQTTSSSMLWLHVQGNRIVDMNGSPVNLRGVNVEEQYFMYATGQHRLNDADMIELVQNWHANVIRVPIMPDLWQFYPLYLQNILDPIVDLGNKYGVYILVDWHAAGNPVTGEAYLPSWRNSFPYHGNPENPNISLATGFWSSVAERYKNDPSVIYDIFNEPFHIAWADWRPVAQQLVDVVQSHNPRALILVPGVSWAYDLSHVKQDPVQRQNIVYDTHPYPKSNVYFGSWDSYFGYLTNYYPVFASEWGFQPGDSDPNLNSTVQSYGQPIVTYMTQKNMSWTAFCWSTVWDPLMLQTRYIPTDFGNLVKDTLSSLDNPTITSSSTTQTSLVTTPTKTTSTSATQTSSSAITSSSALTTLSSTTQSSTSTIVTSSSTPPMSTTTTTSSSTTQSSQQTTTMVTSQPTTTISATTTSTSVSATTTSSSTSQALTITSNPITVTTTSTPSTSTTASSSSASQTSTSTSNPPVFVTVTVMPQTATRTITQPQVTVSVTVTLSQRVTSSRVTTSSSPPSTTTTGRPRPCHQNCEPAPALDEFNILTLLLLVAPFVPRLAYVAAGRRFPPLFSVLGEQAA